MSEQMVQNAILFAIYRFREKRIEPTMAFIREGPYAVPILNKLRDWGIKELEDWIPDFPDSYIPKSLNSSIRNQSSKVAPVFADWTSLAYLFK